MDRKISNHGRKKELSRVRKSGKKNMGEQEGGASILSVRCAQNTKYTSPTKCV